MKGKENRSANYTGAPSTDDLIGSTCMDCHSSLTLLWQSCTNEKANSNRENEKANSKREKLVQALHQADHEGMPQEQTTRKEQIREGRWRQK